MYNKNSVILKELSFVSITFTHAKKVVEKLSFDSITLKHAKKKGFASNGAKNLTLDLDLFWQSPDKFSSNDW